MAENGFNWNRTQPVRYKCLEYCLSDYIVTKVQAIHLRPSVVETISIRNNYSVLGFPEIVSIWKVTLMKC